MAGDGLQPGYLTGEHSESSAVLQPASGALGKFKPRAGAPRYPGRLSPPHFGQDSALGVLISVRIVQLCDEFRPIIFTADAHSFSLIRISDH